MKRVTFEHREDKGSISIDLNDSELYNLQETIKSEKPYWYCLDDFYINLNTIATIKFEEIAYEVELR